MNLRSILARLKAHFDPLDELTPPCVTDPDLVSAIKREARPFGPTMADECVAILNERDEGIAAEMAIEYPESLKTKQIKREIAALAEGKVSPIARRRILKGAP